MWILSKYEKEIINLQQVKSIYVDENDVFADDIIVSEFGTEDEAKKELKQIYDALIAGQESYSVG